MPETPYALLRVSLNGGGAQVGGVAATWEDTVTLDAESTVGWGVPATRWEITDYPDGWATPAGWSLDATTGAIYYLASSMTGTTPPAFDLPTAASNMWGKWKFRLLVNGGGGTLTDWATAVEIVSAGGVHDLAAAESTEFGGVRSWVGPHKENLRALSIAIEGGVGGGASLGAGTPATVSMAAGNDGALLTAAPFGHTHQVLVGTPVAIGEANSTGAGPELAAKNHVHDHGNLTGGARHAVAVASGANGFMTGVDKAKLDGIAAGAGVVNFTNVNAALATANASIDVNGQKITNGAAPTAASDFVIKSYVDGLLFGLDLKGSVRGASTANQSLSGALTEDGVTYVTGDRYLAKNQTTASANGIYVVDTTGPWSRSTDANTSAEVTPGLYVYVEEGTTYTKTGWALTTVAPIVLDTTNLVFTQVFGPGAITAGAGLTQTGVTIEVGAGAGIQVNADSIEVLYAAGGTLTTVNAGDTASAGTDPTAARGDHQHPVSTAAPSVTAISDAGAAAEGVATSLMRSDAKILVKTAAPVSIGTANSIGITEDLARANHVHDHGAQTTSTHHAVAIAGGANGFLSGTDKTKLDGIAAGAQVCNFTNVNAALATANATINVNTQKITGLVAGSAASDAVNFAQLSALATGLDLKQEVRGASTADRTLTGALTEDGITYVTGDRYLAKDQADLTENGIYVVDTAGAWTRSADADTDEEVTPGMFVFVKNEGTVNGNTGWALLVPGPVAIGSTDLTFTQIFGPGTPIAGAGLTQSGNTINVGAGTGITVNANDVAVIYGAGGDLTTVNAGDAASAGVLDKAARADHQHPVSTAAPSPPAVTAAEGSGTALSRSDHIHAWGAAGAALTINRPQHASGAGIKDSLRGQAAAAGAFVGGKLEIGGGDPGNGTVASGDTLILLGEAPAGGISAALIVCRSDGGANYLSVYYDDTKARAVITSASNPYWNQGLRIAGTLSHVHDTLTSSANITMTQGTGNHRRVALVHNTTFEAPTGFEDGTELVLFITQGAGAPWTAAWNAVFKFPTGMSGTLVGNSVDEVDVFRFILKVDQWVCVTHESY